MISAARFGPAHRTPWWVDIARDRLAIILLLAGAGAQAALWLKVLQ